jgi:hypothetical protein
MWKMIFQSVRGTSHERGEQPCQDRCRVRVKKEQDQTLLVLACADGAGSALHADRGASLACQTVTRLVRAELDPTLACSTIAGETVARWFLETREALATEAGRLEVRIGELACTLLLAVVGEAGALFGQIGDGAIVCQHENGYRVVFWPQSGEYPNMTNFLTDAGMEGSLEVEQWPSRVDELALMSDGLQRLALDFATKTAYAPFFLPMFQPLRQAPVPGKLRTALRAFLDSPDVNHRTDDDKTLILATRMTAADHATHLV